MGFHSVGRGDPDKQVTTIATESLPSAKVDIIPSPPENIARFSGGQIGPTGDQTSQIADDLGGTPFVINENEDELVVELFIDGPEGNLKIGEATVAPGESSPFSFVAAASTVRQIAIKEGEKLRARISEDSTALSAKITAPWLDYRMDDVLKLRRVVIASGTGYQDLIPSAELGLKYAPLGGTTGTQSFAVTEDVANTIDFRLNLDGEVIDILAPGAVPAEGPFPILAGAGIGAVAQGESVQARSREGDFVAYMAFLKLPVT